MFNSLITKLGTTPCWCLIKTFVDLFSKPMSSQHQNSIAPWANWVLIELWCQTVFSARSHSGVLSSPPPPSPTAPQSSSPKSTRCSFLHFSTGPSHPRASVNHFQSSLNHTRASSHFLGWRGSYPQNRHSLSPSGKAIPQSAQSDFLITFLSIYHPPAPFPPPSLTHLPFHVLSPDSDCHSPTWEVLHHTAEQWSWQRTNVQNCQKI